MDDLISRTDVDQTVEDNILCYTHSDRPIDQDPDTECHKAIRMALRMLRKDLRKLPSAQSEIIHCRECKHWQSEEYIGNNNVHTLNIASLPCKNWLTAGDWHCGSAERREE